MTPIVRFLKNGSLPNDETEARKIRAKSPMYVLDGETLFKKSYLMPLLRCVGPVQANYIIREVHNGACGMHSGPRATVAKIMNLGYYWPSMYRDATDEIQRCISCQRYSPVPKLPKHSLISVTSAWPFHQWGIDIVGPFPVATGGIKFLLVAIDYFTKWVEAKPLASITGPQIKKFVFENIVCRFGLPGILISDNGKQFADNPLKSWCKEMKIKQKFTSVAHPQANGQVERANRSIVEGIKTRLDKEGGSWLDHLVHVLWAHRTMVKTSNRETPFSLTYGTEAVIPTEIGMPTHRVQVTETNDVDLRLHLNLLEERREIAAINEERYKRQVEGYYNQRVKSTAFKPGDYVFRSNEASRAENQGKLGPNWEGPYQVAEAYGNGAYKLKVIGGDMIPRTWHGNLLRRCYM